MKNILPLLVIAIIISFFASCKAPEYQIELSNGDTVSIKIPSGYADRLTVQTISVMKIVGDKKEYQWHYSERESLGFQMDTTMEDGDVIVRTWATIIQKVN